MNAIEEFCQGLRTRAEERRRHEKERLRVIHEIRSLAMMISQETTSDPRLIARTIARRCSELLINT